MKTDTATVSRHFAADGITEVRYAEAQFDADIRRMDDGGEWLRVKWRGETAPASRVDWRHPHPFTEAQILAAAREASLSVYGPAA